MSCRIFLSYRRKDTAGFAHAIYNILAPEFGQENVFMDVDKIKPGQDFVETLNRAVSHCDVLLVLIGPIWLNITDEKGARRLDDPNDFVRIEIESALKYNKIIIPVLLQGAGMPEENELPTNLRPLSRRQAVSIGDHLSDDVKRLATSIRRAMRDSGERTETGRLTKIIVGVCLIASIVVITLLGQKIIRNYPAKPADSPNTIPIFTSTSESLPIGTATLRTTVTPILTIFPVSTHGTSPTFTPTSFPITPLPLETFFRECRDNAFSSSKATINILPNCPPAKEKNAIQLAWTVPDGVSYAGCTIAPASISSLAKSNSALVFWVYGEYENERVAIKLTDASGLEQGKLITLSTDWQQVVLPLLKDFPDIDAKRLQKLTIGIAYDSSADTRIGRGSACFSDIGFGSP